MFLYVFVFGFVFLNICFLILFYLYGRHIRTISKATHIPGNSYFHYLILRYFNRPYFTNISNTNFKFIIEESKEKQQQQHQIVTINDNNNSLNNVGNCCSGHHHHFCNKQQHHWTDNFSAMPATTNSSSIITFRKEEQHIYCSNACSNDIAKDNYHCEEDDDDDADEKKTKKVYKLLKSKSSTSFLNDLQKLSSKSMSRDNYRQQQTPFNNRSKQTTQYPFAIMNNNNSNATFLSIEEPSYHKCHCYWCRFYVTKPFFDWMSLCNCWKCKFEWSYQQKLDNVFLYPKYQVLKSQMFGSSMWRLSLFLDNYLITSDTRIFNEIKYNNKISVNFKDAIDRNISKMNLIQYSIKPTTITVNERNNSIDRNDDIESVNNNLQSMVELTLNEYLDTLISKFTLMSNQSTYNEEGQDLKYFQNQTSIPVDILESLIVTSLHLLQRIYKCSNLTDNNTSILSNYFDFIQEGNDDKLCNYLFNFFNNSKLFKKILKGRERTLFSLFSQPRSTLLPCIFKKSNKQQQQHQEESIQEVLDQEEKQPSFMDSNKRIKKMAEQLTDNNQKDFCDGQEHVIYYLFKALHYLSSSPECQQLVQQEIDVSFQTKERKNNNNFISFSNFKEKYPYCYKVILETFRLSAPIYTHASKASSSCRITFNNNHQYTQYNIPKDSKLIILFNLLNTDIRYWGYESNCFNPDRFDLNQLQLVDLITPFRNMNLNQDPYRNILEYQMVCTLVKLLGSFKVFPGHNNDHFLFVQRNINHEHFVVN
ncbi:hypothetical protein ABK040_009588 [Willaertia magna]